MSEANQTEHHSGETPIILPTPVALLHTQENKIVTLTRFFSWLTGLALSISVLIALVNVTSERNDLRTQLSCRAAAAVDVNKAIINEQIALADHSVLVGKFIAIIIQTTAEDPTRVDQLNQLATDILAVDKELDKIGADLRTAVAAQQVSLRAC